jgi:hypothetical protein
MSNKHQLIPNTYTICESTEQCKELFDLAKANGIRTRYSYFSPEKVLQFNGNTLLSSEACEMDIKDIQIPLPEFISRLQCKWQPNEVSDYQALYEAEKAKYEKLTQRVKDAQLEFAMYSKAAKEVKRTVGVGDIAQWNYQDGRELAYLKAFEILTEKTGI